MATIGQDIEYASALLKKGDCVAIPTETVYGLAANAFNPDACLKIFKIKNRPSFDPLIVHCHSIEQIRTIVKELPAKAEKLLEAFSPGPITLLLEKKSIISDLVTSGLPTVGVRIPAHPLTLQLLKSLDFPLAAPSANPFGYVSPTTPQHVNDQLGNKLEYILDGGSSEVGIESTIVGFEGEKTIIHRLGGLTLEQIEQVAGIAELRISAHSNPKAPGQTDSHYAPLKPLFVKNTYQIEELLKHEKDTCFICFSNSLTQQIDERIIALTRNENLEEAAQNLFTALRKADQSSFKKIYAEQVPEIGLGLAINDRLKRASVK